MNANIRLVKNSAARAKRYERAKSFAIATGSFTLIAIIIWLDVTTGLWNNLVILSGLAAGLVTFLLTVLVLDKLLARSTARRWAPVNQLALNEFLYSIGDETRTEISRGVIHPRTLPSVDPESKNLAADLHALREQVVRERTLLSQALGTWAQFLASSGDNDQVMRHIAELALQLHQVRDVSLDAEDETTSTTLTELEQQTQECNAAMRALEAELRTQISAEDQAVRKAR